MSVLFLFVSLQTASAGLIVAKNTEKSSDLKDQKGSVSNAMEAPTSPEKRSPAVPAKPGIVSVSERVDIVNKGTSGDGSGAEEEMANVIPQIPQIPKVPAMPTVVRPVNPISGLNKPNTPSAAKVNSVKSPGASQYMVKPSIPNATQMNSQNQGNEASVAKLQEQIQEMLRTNEGLKIRYKEQAADIQKIMDQARIHRDILKGLEENKPLVQKPVELLDAKEILRQEKIRLIRDQVAQNQAFLDGLKNGRAEQQQASKNVEGSKTKS